MKNILITSILVFVMACSGEPGNNTASERVKVIKEQASAMGGILVRKDYSAFVKCTYPKIVELMGGEKKMIDIMEKGAMEMEKEGSAFLETKIGEPSVVIKAGNQLQCTVPITLEMKVPHGHLTNHSTLIAISEDDGKSWYFVDNSGKSLEVMRKVLPELSAQLIIPEKQEPRFYKD
ncbi:MAG: hypothetical protein H7296_10620 [Bacteroidia bacterium]|nr:hypothetical protein [Bacteroidia bacterium]